MSADSAPYEAGSTTATPSEELRTLPYRKETASAPMF